jgi:putative sterol carrier protein
MTDEQSPQPDGASGANGADAALDLTEVSAEDFAALVANSSDEQLAEAMHGPQRDVALPEIFGRMADHIDPAKAAGHDAVVHFQILDRPDGGYDEFEVTIHDGKCEVSQTPSKEPRVTLKIEPVAFLKLITNQATGPGLFMTGKLKIEGDLMYAPQIASLFQVPTAPTQEGSN